MATNIEKKPYGYRLTFSGTITPEEMKAWVDDSQKALIASPAKFGIFVDMRELKPINKETQGHMEEGQKLYKAKGMERSVVILASPILTLQFRQIGKESGIDAWERYIDSSSVTNWEQAGIDWLAKGTEPPK